MLKWILEFEFIIEKNTNKNMINIINLLHTNIIIILFSYS